MSGIQNIQERKTWSELITDLPFEVNLTRTTLTYINFGSSCQSIKKKITKERIFSFCVSTLTNTQLQTDQVKGEKSSAKALCTDTTE